ncbi:hypothetical protein CC80DRAFT_503966 [Byssothecium circinans]|uniref:Uncharacterized protein n=1 Tax=Byssothecium circinans TaxID=147558 RepID=A0A6A5TZ96_9PLEO|nr:hypothetical protein CC80DRAFT_503966 [Byssothecium circinans]
MSYRKASNGRWPKMAPDCQSPASPYGDPSPPTWPAVPEFGALPTITPTTRSISSSSPISPSPKPAQYPVQSSVQGRAYVVTASGWARGTSASDIDRYVSHIARIKGCKLISEDPVTAEVFLTTKEVAGKIVANLSSIKGLHVSMREAVSASPPPPASTHRNEPHGLNNSVAPQSYQAASSPASRPFPSADKISPELSQQQHSKLACGGDPIVQTTEKAGHAPSKSVGELADEFMKKLILRHGSSVKAADKPEDTDGDTGVKKPLDVGQQEDKEVQREDHPNTQGRDDYLERPMYYTNHLLLSTRKEMKERQGL